MCLSGGGSRWGRRGAEGVGGARGGSQVASCFEWQLDSATFPESTKHLLLGLGAPSRRGLRAPRVSAAQIHHPSTPPSVYRAPLFIFPALVYILPSPRFCPQPVRGAVRRLRPGRVPRRAGDARSGRRVPPALLHLQRLFLPPADRRPLRPQGRAATVCQGGLPPVSGQPDLLRHR